MWAYWYTDYFIDWYKADGDLCSVDPVSSVYKQISFVCNVVGNDML